MTDSSRNGLANQLHDQADALLKMDGVDLALALVEAGWVLLDGARHVIDSGKHDAEDLLDVRATCISVSDSLVGILTSVADGVGYEMGVCSDNLTDAQSHLDGLLAKRTQLLEDLRSVREAIDSLPSENRILYENYQSLLHELEELREAPILCNPEKTESLQEEVDDLVEKVEEAERTRNALVSKQKELDEQLKTLTSAIQITKDDVGAIEVETLRTTNDALEQLMPSLATGREVRAKVDMLRQSVAEYIEIADGYSTWLTTDRRSAAALAREVAELPVADIPSLSSTLCDDGVQAIRDAVERAESSVRQLDELVGDAARALEMDQKAISRKARR